MRGAPLHSRFIFSPRADLALLLGVTLTTLLPWLAVERFGVAPYHVLVVAALLNGPHLVSTWTRVYLPRSERWARPVYYWVVPALALAFALACYAAGEPGPTLARTLIFYWASWHFVAQSWGVLRIYERKQRTSPTMARLEKALVFVPAFYFIARRIYTGPWQLFGAFIYHPHLPALLVNALGAASIALGAVYLAHFRLGDGGAASLLRPLHLVSSAIGFAVPYCCIQNGTAAFAAAAAWHAAQYLAIVWSYHRTRWRRGIEADAPWLSWASQPGRGWAYAALLGAGALGVYLCAFVASLFCWSFQRWALALWTGLTLGHYFLDGVIWKFARYRLEETMVQARGR